MTAGTEIAGDASIRQEADSTGGPDESGPAVEPEPRLMEPTPTPEPETLASASTAAPDELLDETLDETPDETPDAAGVEIPNDAPEDATGGTRLGSVVGKALAEARRTAAPAAASEPGQARRVTIEGLGLADAVGLSIARHPEIQRAGALVLQGEADVEVARSAWYPTLDYGVRPGYGIGPGNGGDSGEVRGTVGLNQLVYDFGRTPSREAIAEASLVRQRYQQADTVESVAYNTATIFIDLATSQDIIAAAQRQRRALAELGSMIRQRVKAGLSSTTDLNRAETAIQRAEAEALSAQTRYDVAASKLVELIGVRPSRVATLVESAKLVVSADMWDDDDIGQTPGVLAAQAALQVADAKVDLAKADQYPSIGVGVSRSASTNDDFDDSTFFGLSLSGSFSLGGLAKHRVASAKAERVAALQELENRLLVARSMLHSSETEAEGAVARQESYNKVIRLTRSSRGLYWQEYTLNKRPLTEVIDAEREIYSSEVASISAVADGVLADIRRHAAVGMLVPMLGRADAEGTDNE
ncbi:TolC family protein [Nitratidesulfovibrio termitidis]|uniref:TolC family protein n=1 Tax=Nitratidesulfovibrio termitidis TaxID=42252 RepID=UPI000687399B|nr:TolC family protein [Nitratidesulfovibrio termitidis]